MRRPQKTWAAVLATVWALAAGAAWATEPDAANDFPDHMEFLPPQLPWDGQTRRLMLPPDHPWATPSERERLTTSPRYEETIAWLRSLVDASPDLAMHSIGRSAEGRSIWMVVAARGISKTPRALVASGKPIVLAHAGIHSGEIDGKDAGMMLLRDMTVHGRRKQLLDEAHFLFIPILNVDGHERSSRFARINQRGPREMGWRTNARNLNLNRDFAKLETEGVRAVVDVINRWQPDLYLDLHVTDGVDYAYDVTWGATADYGWSPAVSRWVDRVFTPGQEQALREAGHLPGPLIFPVNGRNFDAGLAMWMGSPRFSNTYGSVRHLPAILVENHSLKPYDQRVLGTYVFLQTSLELAAADLDGLRRAVAEDRARRANPFPLGFRAGEEAKTEIRSMQLVSSETTESPITGGSIVRWTGKVEQRDVTWFHQSVPSIQVARPRAYLIPPAWGHIVDKLEQHGIDVERLDGAQTVEVERYRLPQAKSVSGGSAFDATQVFYEGRVRVDPGTPRLERGPVAFPAGSYRVSTDQPLGDLAILLLEPQSADSYFQWGYFMEVLARTEYAEAYVMEPMAQAMLDSDPELRRAFERRLREDPAFAADPRARLQWFYRRTPYFDDQFRLYPVARLP